LLRGLLPGLIIFVVFCVFENKWTGFGVMYLF
jgi:hypothetical protein